MLNVLNFTEHIFFNGISYLYDNNNDFYSFLYFKTVQFKTYYETTFLTIDSHKAI